MRGRGGCQTNITRSGKHSRKRCLTQTPSNSETGQLQAKARKLLVKILNSPIACSRDAAYVVSVLNFLTVHGTLYERPIRRALLHLLAFLQHPP